jgi:predicted component of type VI protein secretion system
MLRRLSHYGGEGLPSSISLRSLVGDAPPPPPPPPPPLARRARARAAAAVNAHSGGTATPPPPRALHLCRGNAHSAAGAVAAGVQRVWLSCAEAPLLMSRSHAGIERCVQPDGTHAYMLSDLGSTNGTYVNGAQLLVGAARALAPGDCVSLGGPSVTVIARDAQGTQRELDSPFLFVFDDDDDAGAEATAVLQAAVQAPPPTQDDPHGGHHRGGEEPYPASVMQLLARAGAAAAAAEAPPPAAVCEEPPLPPPRRRAEPLARRSLACFAGRLRDLVGCSVCFCVAVAPHSLPGCGHVFCGACILPWLDRQQSCPNCRARVAAPPAHNVALEAVIDMALAGTAMPAAERAEREAREAEWARLAAERASARGGGLKRRRDEGAGGAEQQAPAQRARRGPHPAALLTAGYSRGSRGAAPDGALQAHACAACARRIPFGAAEVTPLQPGGGGEGPNAHHLACWVPPQGGLAEEAVAAHELRAEDMATLRAKLRAAAALQAA